MKINIRVFPNSKNKKINIISEKEIEIYFRQKAENNLANKKVLEIVSEIYSKNINEVKIISGYKKKEKILLLKNHD